MQYPLYSTRISAYILFKLRTFNAQSFLVLVVFFKVMEDNSVTRGKSNGYSLLLINMEHRKATRSTGVTSLVLGAFLSMGAIFTTIYVTMNFESGKLMVALISVMGTVSSINLIAGVSLVLSTAKRFVSLAANMSGN